MHPTPLVETTRGYPDSGYTAENVHRGSVAVVDRDGSLLWHAGDPHALTFTRSALKPFQALPLLRAGGAERFGLSTAELAMLCASHSGEPMHVQTVRALLSKVDMAEGELACGCHAPLYYDAVGKAAPQDVRWSAVHHNCSGKHSGFLAWCRLHDVPSAGYLERDHPLQLAVRAQLADLLGVAATQLPTGLDGCSAPNYALPLARLAWLYAHLADARAEPALGTLYDAMTAHPELVSGQARCDLAYMHAGGGDWVSKVGADAVQLIGVRSAGIAIAIKVADGGVRALNTATYSVLDQLGLLDDARRAALAAYRAPPLLNARGSTVGQIRAVFTLKRAC